MRLTMAAVSEKQINSKYFAEIANHLESLYTGFRMKLMLPTD